MFLLLYSDFYFSS